MGRLARLAVHVDLVARARRPADRTSQPSPSRSSRERARRRRRAGRSPPARLARPPAPRTSSRSARGSAAGRRGRASALVEHRPGLRRLDPPVVEALGQDDDVAGEAVAADVRRLPDPVVLDLLAHARRRAAGRSLRSSGRACRACTRGGAGARPARRRSQVEVEQVVVAARARAGAARARASAERATNARSPSGRGARCGGRRGASCAGGAGARSRRCALTWSESAVPGEGVVRPEARGTRSGSSGRRGSQSPRAARASRARRLRAERPGATSSGTTQITCPVATALAGGDRKLRTTARAGAP